MYNWMYFPSNEKDKNLSEQESLDMLLFMLSRDQRFMISKEEWNTLMPETRPPRQKPSLGFCCGDLSGAGGMSRDLKSGLPEVRIHKYHSDLLILKKAWENNFFCVVEESTIPGKYMLTSVPRMALTVMIPGMLVLERSIFVWGSKSTRFSKYRMPIKEFDKIITLDLQKR